MIHAETEKKETEEEAMISVVESLKSMESAEEENGTEIANKNKFTKIGVSYDGSWPTRGYKSKHGFGSMIDLFSGFVLDFDVVSKFCQACTAAAKKFVQDSPEFNAWLQNHECDVTHSGSSGVIEVTIAENIWKGSEKYGFRYTKMLSDGDSKAFNLLSSLIIYGPDCKTEKEECINHLGNR